jgi:RNA polymerase sigma factor (sigma-70 family)
MFETAQTKNRHLAQRAAQYSEFVAERTVDGNYKEMTTVSDPGVVPMSHSVLAADLRRLRGKLASQQRTNDGDEQLLHAFADFRDEHAFSVLVRRHGPMVLRVCRRVLGHEQDAEDAFQATFLVLARNAAALRKKAALASFLHGTAYRLAPCAKRASARRRKHERQAVSGFSINPADELSWREVRELLDEEIAHLPEKYRTIFVLCCLEELSQAEAARRLGMKERTASNRLAEARKRLGRRLSRRGVELSAVLAVTGVEVKSASALPPVLAASTVKAAVATTGSEGMAGIVSASVAELVENATVSAMLSKTKMAMTVLLAVSLLAGAGMWWRSTFFASPQRQQGQPVPSLRTGKQTEKRDPAKVVEIHGRVLGPDGKPKAGVKLVLVGDGDEVKQLGVSAADGHFSVVVPKEKMDGEVSALLARSRDTGLDFIRLGGWDAAKPVELRLVKDQAIRGRIVNTEGKPISGVQVSVSNIDVYPNNSLESAQIRGKVNHADRTVSQVEKTLWVRAASLLTASTDAEGRFIILGVGAERVAQLDLQRGGIANAKLWVANHDGFDPKTLTPPAFDASQFVPGPPKRANPPPTYGMTLEGPNFAFIAEMEKPIRGTVRDVDSGKAIPSVPVRLEQDHGLTPGDTLVAKTDAQGRFEFHGARKNKTYSFHVSSDSSAGYLAAQSSATDTVGYAPLHVNLRIKKGVIVTGKIIDKATGKAVPGFAQFEVLVNNPFAKDYPGVRTQREETAADGTFRVVVIPGAVLLMGGFYPPQTTEEFDYIALCKYRPPIADPDYPQYFAKLPGPRNDAVGYLSYGGGRGLIQGNYCKVLDIKPGTAVVHQDLFLERASVLEARIQDADGKPVTGVWATDFATNSFIGPLWIDRSTCPVYGLESRKPRLLIFYEPKRKIIGSRRLQGDEKGPITVRLESMAGIKGRLLDGDGKPLVGVAITVLYRDSEANKIHWDIYATKQIVTDAKGAFTLDELIPAVKFELAVQTGKANRSQRELIPTNSLLEVKPGENRDLGEIRRMPTRASPQR